MKPFNNLSIKWKLNLMIMLTSTLGLILIGTAFYHMYRRQTWTFTVQEVQNMARLIAVSSDSALAFDDPGTARRLLQSLAVDPQIVYACISDRGGRRFAEYRPNGSGYTPESATAAEKGRRFDNAFITMQEPVTLDGVQIGTVQIVRDMAKMNRRLKHILQMTVLDVLGALGLVGLMTCLLQRMLVRPLAGLAATAGTISNTKDYALRAAGGGRGDEVGALVRSFNAMVTEVQHRDKFLEEQVNARTGELLQANEGLRREMQERIKAEKRIFASLREKEVLLKEVHHRVKNNLTVISALLSLQAEKSQSAPLREALETCRQRVRTMAAIHSFLYASDNLAQIDFGDYLRGLVNSLKGSHASGPEAPLLRVQAEKSFLDLETAVPCGLIVNELVTNAFKHAFVQGPPGEIFVGFRKETEQYCLEVADDGVGLPPGVDGHTGEGLGLKIIHLLVVQLRGHLEIRRDPGTRFVITFNPSGKQESSHASV